MGCRCLLSIAVAVAITVACSDEADAPARAADGPAPFGRIVLVSIDTLRADHLGVYGYPRPTSPFLDALAADSVVFDRAYSSMSTTSPAHASIFTGLHPLQHGVFRNGRRLADRFRTLAEALRERGYRTAGFSATRSHFAAANLAQGFELFDEPGAGGGRRRPADRVVDAALAWLADTAAPWFVFVHLYDVHHPWRPPAEDRAAATARGAGPAFWRDAQAIAPGFYRDAAQMRETIDGYDGEIHFVDRQLRRLYDALAGGPPTLWIVTADHGEGLGDHGWLFHGKHIYDEQIRVPLIVHASDGRFRPGRVGAVVRHIDLWPTLAAPSVAALEGAVGPGRSLLPALLGGELRAAATLAQRRRFDPNPEADALAERGALPPDSRYEPGDAWAWVADGWKLIHRTRGRDELFDLRADPYETTDRMAAEPGRAERMRAALDARLRALAPEAAPRSVGVDAKTADALRALGYLP